MASFDINPKTHNAAKKQAKINNMKKSDNPNERAVADRKLSPSAKVSVPNLRMGQQEEIIPGLNLVDVILGEEKCGKGMYYCYTDKKCKKLPAGLKMTARFGGGGREPEEVGIDKPVEGGEGGNGGNGGGDGGGGMGESLAIEDAFGNKFMEVIDLIKPEDVVEKCWDGYKKKGMKTMFGKKYPNCVKEGDKNSETYVKGSAPVRATYGGKPESFTKEKYIKKSAKATTKEEIQVKESHKNPESVKGIAKELDKAVEMHKSQAKRLRKSGVSEGLRLPAEYGNLLAVVVIWRGRSLMIKMFFPQAAMPKKSEIQTEIEKVYPGGRVTQFQRTSLPSEYSPHNSPILKVQKEEVECAGTPQGKDCGVHGQKCCPSLSEKEVDEAAGEKDACYKKIKASAKVWPSAYASGRLVQCRKKGAANYGNKSEGMAFDQFKEECWKTHKKVGMKMKGGKLVNDCRPKNEENDVDENRFAAYGGKDTDAGYAYANQNKGGGSKTGKVYTMMGKDGKPLFDKKKETKEDWQKANRKDKTDGLSQSTVNAYKRENPGSKLKTAVTTKPSKIKKGSKDAKRRSSFCSRMSGMKKRLTSAKTARDPDSKINKALRRWNCN